MEASHPPHAHALPLPCPPALTNDAAGPYAHDFSGLPERTNAAAGLYAKACLEVARQCGLRAIDIWCRMQRFPGWEKSFLRDGLDLTLHGNRVLFEEVVLALKDANLSL
ncbi:GDSL esterase/lipase At5g45920-like [Sorghum bicolor]|uniref:GDSL esterase/lipase At5g45920-like n=1 Tax=Sorghum bicolor TaxID=4558 RepID=UPI000B42503B|nr:GDSL esterase/lipase At5g45920-like [Sorghum bicolor]|eukprot:XP_021305552.1 GDSL esterase/lipase At5g45920-like [Sorghum bicolor]